MNGDDHEKLLNVSDMAQAVGLSRDRFYDLVRAGIRHRHAPAALRRRATARLFGRALERRRVQREADPVQPHEAQPRSPSPRACAQRRRTSRCVAHRAIGAAASTLRRPGRERARGREGDAMLLSRRHRGGRRRGGRATALPASVEESGCGLSAAPMSSQYYFANELLVDPLARRP